MKVKEANRTTNILKQGRKSGTVQHMKISIRDLLYEQYESKESHIHLSRWRKGIWQNPITIHDKSFREIRKTRDMSNIIKAFCNKIIANIKSNEEKFKEISLLSYIRTCDTLSLFNSVLKQ